MKQEDIAMLLRVTRSQWSMFELRKRDLPIGAKLKLAEMLGLKDFRKEEDARVLREMMK